MNYMLFFLIPVALLIFNFLLIFQLYITNYILFPLYIFVVPLLFIYLLTFDFYISNNMLFPLSEVSAIKYFIDINCIEAQNLFPCETKERSFEYN